MLFSLMSLLVVLRFFGAGKLSGGIPNLLRAGIRSGRNTSRRGTGLSFIEI